MRRFLLAGAVCALGLYAAPAQASVACHTFNGMLRDFSFEHPNFEEGTSGLELGIVLPDLGVDGTPDFNPLTTATTVTNATDFFDWYHDTPASMSKEFDFGLIEDEPGVYKFSESQLFPIDGELLDNEGNPHNYHFTLQASMPFVYGLGQYLHAMADDDLWIFIDGKLAIDLGGAHPVTAGTIDIDTLGLTPGETYMIDLFYAERQTTEAQLHIETNVECPNVPEPSTFVLGGLASLGAGLCWWRRRK